MTVPAATGTRIGARATPLGAVEALRSAASSPSVKGTQSLRSPRHVFAMSPARWSRCEPGQHEKQPRSFTLSSDTISDEASAILPLASMPLNISFVIGLPLGRMMDMSALQ